MKKTVWLLVAFCTLMLCCCAHAEQNIMNEKWNTAPRITDIYEVADGQIRIEWTGMAEAYQVHLDDGDVMNVETPYVLLKKVKVGGHHVQVFPLLEMDKEKAESIGVEIKSEYGVGLNVDVPLGKLAGFLGIDKQVFVRGTNASEQVDYRYDKKSNIGRVKVKNIKAFVDSSDTVCLTFEDDFHADEYKVTIYYGDNIHNIIYTGEQTAKGWGNTPALLERNSENNTVTLRLTPDYLKTFKCGALQMGQKYSFTVQLRMYSSSLLHQGRVLNNVILESKESSRHTFVPQSLWMDKPVIESCEQVADGRLEIKWSHPGLVMGCSYDVLVDGKVAASSNQDKAMVDGLLDGSYSITVKPRLNGKEGSESVRKKVKVENNWSAAPQIVRLEQIADGKVEIGWNHAGAGCQYRVVLKHEAFFGVGFYEIRSLTTADRNVIVDQVPDGTVQVTVQPVLKEENGKVSKGRSIKVKNSWNVAPEFRLEQVGNGGNVLLVDVKVMDGIRKYQVEVYVKNDDRKLLQPEYSKYGEMEIVPGLFSPSNKAMSIDKEPREAEMRVRVKVWGVHVGYQGEEFTTPVAQQDFTLKMMENDSLPQTLPLITEEYTDESMQLVPAQ
ncbi:MAG: hypothetical protein IKJ51_01575 [Clostridia bacterium]|nr:hypothetical protein [Clostridia bacterium]